MNFYTEKQILYIDTSRRQSGSHSNFSYVLDINQFYDYDSVVLLDASIPKSTYLINENNNTFVVTENGINRTITVPPGNYNRSSFKNVVLQKLNEGSYTYTMTFDNSAKTGDDGKFTFSCLETTPTFTFSNNLYRQMGFENNTSYTFVNSSIGYGSTLLSANVTNFRYQSVYFIISDICQNYNNNVLQSIISTNFQDYNYITYHCLDPISYTKDFIREKSNLYNFRLVDENFQEIDLNGIAMNLTIMLYKKNTIDKLFKQYIKMKVLTGFNPGHPSG